jgi:YD repeat-containing protein
VADPEGFLGGAQWFDQEFKYDELGRLVEEAYPDCGQVGCEAVSAPRSLGYDYFEGYLTGVREVGIADDLAALTYHDNGALSSVAHGNGALDSVGQDPHRMGRPESLTSTFGVATPFASGQYQYDPSGNIKSIGTDAYAYDPASRLVRASVLQGGNATDQAFAYDAKDNLVSTTTNGVVTANPVDPATNRLNGYDYDQAGNLCGGGSLGTFVYDAQGMVTRSSQGSRVKSYLLTPEDERLVVTEEDRAAEDPVTVRGCRQGPKTAPPWPDIRLPACLDLSRRGRLIRLHA